MKSIHELIKIIEQQPRIYDWDELKRKILTMYVMEIESAYSDGIEAVKRSIVEDTGYTDASDYANKQIKDVHK